MGRVFPCCPRLAPAADNKVKRVAPLASPEEDPALRILRYRRFSRETLEGPVGEEGEEWMRPENIG
jgi:hypothetical protein